VGGFGIPVGGFGRLRLGREVTGLRVAMVTTTSLTTTSMESSRFRRRKKGPAVMAIFALANRHRRLNAPAQPTLIDVAPWRWEQQQPGSLPADAYPHAIELDRLPV
jgi:hypothetical protein